MCSLIISIYIIAQKLSKMFVLCNGNFIAIKGQFSLSPQLLLTTILVPASGTLTVFDTSYNWDGAAFACLCEVFVLVPFLLL